MTIEKVVGGFDVAVIFLDRHGDCLSSLNLDGLGDDFLACATQLLQGVCCLLEIAFFTLKGRAISTAIVGEVGGCGRMVARQRMTGVEGGANVAMRRLVKFGTGQIDFGRERGA